MYTRDTELRRLQSNDVNRLAEALGFDGGRKLMETIPKYWTNPNILNAGVSTTQSNYKLNGEVKNGLPATLTELKYRPEQIRLIEEATRQTSGCYFAEILIQEWSTSGRKHERPTVGLLLQLLIKADLWNAADFVAEHFLDEPVPERPLEGPGAKVDISIPTECLGSVADFVNDSIGSYPDTEMLNANFNGLADHNRDYYIKFSHFSKDINGAGAGAGAAPPKPPPRTQHAARQQNIRNQLQQQQKLQRTQFGNSVATIEETHEHRRSRTEQNESIQANKQQQSVNLNNTSVSGNMTERNIPVLSGLLGMNSSQHVIVKSEEVANEASMPLMLLDAKNSTTITNHTNTISIGLLTQQCGIAPATASALSLPSSSTTNVVSQQNQPSNSILCCDSLPLITELNLSAETMDNGAGFANSQNSRQQQLNASSPNNSSSGGSRCSSLSSNDSFDDDEYGNAGYNGATINSRSNIGGDADGGNSGDADLPYLSVFGRQSPNNDSSLTTVTCTSGENSFDLSLNESSSTSTTDPTAQRK